MLIFRATLKFADFYSNVYWNILACLFLDRSFRVHELQCRYHLKLAIPRRCVEVSQETIHFFNLGAEY